MSTTVEASEEVYSLFIASSWMANSFSTLVWIVGSIYIFIALKKSREKIRKIDGQTTAWGVIAAYSLSGFVILALPFTQQAQCHQYLNFIESWLAKIPNAALYTAMVFLCAFR